MIRTLTVAVITTLTAPLSLAQTAPAEAHTEEQRQVEAENRLAGALAKILQEAGVQVEVVNFNDPSNKPLMAAGETEPEYRKDNAAHPDHQMRTANASHQGSAPPIQ